jgi:hypothetical protein
MIYKILFMSLIVLLLAVNSASAYTVIDYDNSKVITITENIQPTAPTTSDTFVKVTQHRI